MSDESDAYEYDLCMALLKADGFTEDDWHLPEMGKLREDTRRRVKHLLPLVGQVEPMYDVPAVAKIFGLSGETIRDWIGANKIGATKVHGYWRIPRSEILRVSNDRHGD